jgi:ketosteroid isomerase-like protein
LKLLSARRTGAVGMLLLLSACGSVASHPQRLSIAPSAAEEAAIREARIAQNRAIAAGDLDAVATFWTEDVTIRRGLGQPISGRVAYRRLFDNSGGRDSALVYQRETTDIDVSPHWGLAFESGTWAGHLGAAGGPAVIRGRYSAQWVERGGRWLIRSEVFVALTCAGVGCSYAAVP